MLFPVLFIGSFVIPTRSAFLFGCCRSADVVDFDAVTDLATDGDEEGAGDSLSSQEDIDGQFDDSWDDLPESIVMRAFVDSRLRTVQDLILQINDEPLQTVLLKFHWYVSVHMREHKAVHALFAFTSCIPYLRLLIRNQSRETPRPSADESLSIHAVEAFDHEAVIQRIFIASSHCMDILSVGGLPDDAVAAATTKLESVDDIHKLEKIVWETIHPDDTAEEKSVS